MDTNNPTIAYLLGAVLLAAAIAIEHMAFRTAKWQRKELARRAIGDTTVLVMVGVFVVYFGGGDWLTWLAIVAGYVIAMTVKLIMQWNDDTRRAALMGQINDDGKTTD